MFEEKTSQPDWTEKPPKKGSYRSIFKWGSPDVFKHPSSAWYTMIKEEFKMTDEDFKKPAREGNEKVVIKQKIKLTKKKINQFIDIVGKRNVATDDYSRVKYSHGKTVDEAMDLRNHVVHDVPDIVVHPRNKADVQKVVEFCNKWKIPIYVFGGGSSVTYGLSTPKSGVMLVMSTYMNKLLSISELNQTAVVQPGMFGPAYEAALNNPPKKFKVKRRYTCGHFPQSFEY